MAKEKLINPKKIKLRYDEDLSLEELVILANEENASAVALLLEKQETFNSIKVLGGQLSDENQSDKELIDNALKVLEKRLGKSKYDNLCKKAEKESQNFDKQVAKDRNKHYKNVQKGFNSLFNNHIIPTIKGVGKIRNEISGQAVKCGKTIYRLALAHKDSLKQLTYYSEEIKKMMDNFTEDDGTSIQ